MAVTVTPIAPLSLVKQHLAGLPNRLIFSPMSIAGVVRLAIRKYGISEWLYITAIRSESQGPYTVSSPVLVGSWMSPEQVVVSASGVAGAVAAMHAAIKAQRFPDDEYFYYGTEGSSSAIYPVETLTYIFKYKKIIGYDVLAGMAGGLFTFKTEGDAAMWLSINLDREGREVIDIAGKKENLERYRARWNKALLKAGNKADMDMISNELDVIDEKLARVGG